MDKIALFLALLAAGLVYLAIQLIGGIIIPCVVAGGMALLAYFSGYGARTRESKESKEKS